MLAGRVGGARRATNRVCWCDDVLVEQRIRAMQAAGAGDAVKIRCTFIRDNPNSRAISRTENPSALVPVVPADPVLALLTEADMALGR
jgi:hypothetical protein